MDFYDLINKSCLNVSLGRSENSRSELSAKCSYNEESGLFGLCLAS
jgi:hypothetical protein